MHPNAAKGANSGVRNGIDWRARIEQALMAAPLDSAALYAGDDRRRMARQRAAGVGQVRQAGVLILIVADQRPHIVLTERSQSLRSHPGQISFPGGSVEPSDASVKAAAIRETREEIGLAPEQLQILGRLPDYVTGTGFNIAPFVGWVAGDVEFAPDAGEVARLFSVPLDFVIDADHFRLEQMTIQGVDYRFHVIEYEDNYIWGATAAMLFGLRACVGAVTSGADSGQGG